MDTPEDRPKGTDDPGASLSKPSSKASATPPDDPSHSPTSAEPNDGPDPACADTPPSPEPTGPTPTPQPLEAAESRPRATDRYAEPRTGSPNETLPAPPIKPEAEGAPLSSGPARRYDDPDPRSSDPVDPTLAPQGPPAADDRPKDADGPGDSPIESPSGTPAVPPNQSKADATPQDPGPARRNNGPGTVHADSPSPPEANGPAHPPQQAAGDRSADADGSGSSRPAGGNGRASRGLRGLVERAVRSARSGPPPGPTRPGFWRSPLRGPWLTSVLGAVLLVGIVVLFVTGLLSYAAYNPGLADVNDRTPGKGLLGAYLFDWPTDPPWLYRLTQGVHVTLGVVLVPVLPAKLWSVVPKLFTWPPVRSIAHALERLSLLLLVGGALFVFATGILNIQLEYVFPGSFYPLHFFGAWVFIAAFAAHVALRFTTMVRSLRSRGLLAELRAPSTAPEPDDGSGLVTPDPGPATASRRGVLGTAALGSLALFAVTVGQSLGGVWRETALLAPRGRDPGSGPNGFQINKTAQAAGISTADIGPDWRLTVRGAGREVVLTRSEVAALPQATAALPIACVEGWSTTDQEWSGVRLRDLAALVGLGDRPPGVFVESAQRSGAFRSAALSASQVGDARSLLALKVNGADLSPDHGSPARVIVPANPGVHNTKWVTVLDFGGPA